MPSLSINYLKRIFNSTPTPSLAIIISGSQSLISPKSSRLEGITPYRFLRYGPSNKNTANK